MRRFAKPSALLLLAGMIACNCVTAQQLHYNPFSRPAEFGNAAVALVPGADVADGLRLRGVLVDGDQSMANIGGVIVPLGGEVGGYRLISVEEGQAVLEKQGVTTLLVIEPNKRTME